MHFQLIYLLYDHFLECTFKKKKSVYIDSRGNCAPTLFFYSLIWPEKVKRGWSFIKYWMENIVNSAPTFYFYKTILRGLIIFLFLLQVTLDDCECIAIGYQFVTLMF